MAEISIVEVIKMTMLLVLLTLAIWTHCRRKQKAVRAIGLLVFYCFIYVLIFVFTFMRKYIPMIFIILVLTSTSQVFQVSLYMRWSKLFVPKETLKRNQNILMGFVVLYLLMILLTAFPFIGPMCQQAEKGVKNDTFPLCFISLFVVDFLFWVFTNYLKRKTFNIDDQMLEDAGSRQTERLLFYKNSTEFASGHG